MSCILKPTTSELFVASPTMINVHEWLTIHHAVAGNDDCGGKSYHVFAVTEYPIFGSQHEYINTKIGIPFGPLTIELAGQIGVGESGPHLSQVTVNVKYPLLASVNAGTYKGDFNCDDGIKMAIGVPEICGTLRLWVQSDGESDPSHPFAQLWVEFDLKVFDVEYKGKFALLPIPHWFTSSDEPTASPMCFFRRRPGRSVNINQSGNNNSIGNVSG